MRVRTKQLDLARCELFGLDEYYPIDPADARSLNHQLSAVAEDLEVPADRFHILLGDIPRDQIQEHCEQYEESIRRAGGIDFQILGVGRSGHIGFNEPGSDLDSRTRLVPLHRLTVSDAAPNFGGLNQVPREALTMGMGTILEARELALIAQGDRKAGIVRHLIEEPHSQAVPASCLQTHPCAGIYLDKDAARYLTPAPGLVCGDGTWPEPPFPSLRILPHKPQPRIDRPAVLARLFRYGQRIRGHRADG